MLRRCAPLHPGDDHEVCGALFDDVYRMAVCPHVSLAGGDTVGIAPDPAWLAGPFGVLAAVQLGDPDSPFPAPVADAPCRKCQDDPDDRLEAVWAAISDVTTRQAATDLEVRSVDRALMGLCVGIIAGGLVELVQSIARRRGDNEGDE